MKLLSICIPTYNRPDSLKKIHSSFLIKALENYEDKIQIMVFDNSDEDIGKINSSLLDTRIKYSRNKNNQGFHGSLRRCVTEAKLPFVWIISDDDIILWEGFQNLMEKLPGAYEDNIDCINLPINYRNPIGDFFETTKEELKKNDTHFSDFIGELPTVPFGFFANVVLRLNKERIDEIYEELGHNFIINVPLFISMLNPESNVRFMDTPVIEYQEIYSIRMDVLEFFDCASEIIHFIEKDYDIDGIKLIDHTYKESLLMMLAHRTGLRKYRNVDETMWPLLKKLPSNFNVKSMMLAFVVFLPGIMTRKPYLMYESINFTKSNGSNTPQKILQRYNVLSEYVKNKVAEYNINNK